MNQEERQEKARDAERIINRIAGIVRNRIIEGMDIGEAMAHESIQYWSEQLEKINSSLNAN